MQEASRRASTVRDQELKTADLKVKLSTLTPREREVLDLLVEGQPSKIVASRLGMSVRTAEHYRARIMEKVGAPSTARLIAMVSAIVGSNGSTKNGAEGPVPTDRTRYADLRRGDRERSTQFP